MTLKRLTFVIIYLILSSFSPDRSWAENSDLLDTSDVAIAIDKAVAGKKSSQRLLRRFTAEPALTVGKLYSQRDRESAPSASARWDKVSQRQNTGMESNETSESKTEASQVISRNWSVKALLLTSGIALILLWVLFRQPSQTAADEQAIAEPQEPLSQNSTSSSDMYSAFKDADLDISTEPNKIAKKDNGSLTRTPEIAKIDVVQELIDDLQPTAAASNNLSSQANLRRKAIWELTKIGDYRSIEPLIAILSQANELDKALILEAVKQITERSFQPINCQLFAGLQDRCPEVRLSALRDLRNLYQFAARAIAKIAQMQSDPDYEVRQTAVQALQQFSINPLPEFANFPESEVNDLISGEESGANLHLVAYLLAELDAEK